MLDAEAIGDGGCRASVVARHWPRLSDVSLSVAGARLTAHEPGRALGERASKFVLQSIRKGAQNLYSRKALGV